jgi:hypothetical protein
MNRENRRRQYAVGQGYFHSAELLEDGEVRLRYVVDCGAMSKYAAARNARIDAYLEEVGIQQPLDLLFISHAHADHLNGVGRLLDKSKGLAVKTIVMPLMSIEDRLIAFARTALEDAASTADSFVRAFAVDPVAAVRRFDPDRILLVERGGAGDDGAPFRFGPGDGPGPDLPRHSNDADVPRSWEFVGRGSLRPFEAGAAGTSRGRVEVMPDTIAFLARAHGASTDWLLAPFIDPSVKADAAKFMAALAEARGTSVRALKRWLRSTANRQKLLTDDTADLKGAFAAIDKDLNVTSLCLYSGPLSRVQSHKRYYEATIGKWTLGSAESATRGAWLGTGDAALADKKRRGAFFKHYGKLLEQVTTLTLPHHGSENNFHPELVECIEPDLCVASADQFSFWRHPGSGVTQAIASVGKFVSVVTSDPRSEVSEHVAID